ncbi:MAG: aspartate/glutamate racemase family protein [Nocardioides sp.]
MRTIGLIGGMSWHSTLSYYRLINETVAARLGGHSSASITMRSLDFGAVRELQVNGDWDGATTLLTEAARQCVAGGADLMAICTNLMHKVAPAVEAAIDVPLIHVADAVAEVARREGWTRLGLLGAKWVMEETFYADRLARHGIEAIAPEAADRETVDRVIFEELTQGRVREQSRTAYVEVIGRLAERGAHAAVLACTEIGLLLEPGDGPLPLIDSTEAHAAALADAALAAGR